MVSGLAEALTLPGSGWLLEQALTARYSTHSVPPTSDAGGDGRGQLSAAVLQAAATALGVTPATVRSWTRNRSPHRTVPANRLPQLLTELQPTEATRQREHLELAHARQALARLEQDPEQGDWAQWQHTNWLSPHRLLLLKPAGSSGLRRLAITIDQPATATRHSRNATVLDQALAANKFTATVLRHHVLEAVDGWRIITTPQHQPRGHTHTWLAAAYLPNLATLTPELDAHEHHQHDGTC